MEQREMVVSADSLHIRIYSWAWEARPEDADLCKLFWGTIFLPVAMVIHLLGVIIGPPYRFLEDFWNSWLLTRTKKVKFEDLPIEPDEPDEPEVEKDPNFMERLLTSIGSAAARVSMFLQSKVWVWLRWIVIPVMALIGLALLVGLIYLLVLLIIDVWMTILIVLGGILCAALIILLGIWQSERLQKSAKKTGAGIKKFFQIMGAGAVGFKHATCPKITVVKEDK